MKTILKFMLFIVTMFSMTEVWSFGQFMFSDKGYANNITAQGWMITKQQMHSLFCDSPHQEPKQLSYGELAKHRLYLAVKLSNTKAYRAWGVLECSSPSNFRVNLDVSDVEPLLKESEYYIIPLGEMGFPRSEYNDIPEICFRWKKLYVK